MSQIEESQPEEKPKLPPEARLEIIKKGILEGWHQGEIAHECGVCRETISRDMRKWKLTGGYEIWVRAEFFDMHQDAKEEDFIAAYKEISKHAQRTMTQRTEARVEGFTLRIWQPGDKDEDQDPEPKDL